MSHIDRSALNHDDLRRVFLLNPENRPLLAGEALPQRRKPWRVIETGVVVFWLVIGIWLIDLTARTIHGYIQITRAPVEILADYAGRQAYITDDDIRYTVIVAYTVEGTDYRRAITVSKTAYDRADSGEPWRVFYAAGEPGIVVHELPTPMPVLLAVAMALVWNIPLAAVLGSRIRSGRRRKPPLRRGKLIYAEKVRTWASLRSDHIYLLNIEYRFVSPASGQTITDTAQHPREDLRVSVQARPLQTAEVLPDTPPLVVIFQHDRRYELL